MPVVLLPNGAKSWDRVTKASCRDVIHAVAGVRGSATLHWVRAFGLIDNDHRAPDEVERLKAEGVYALPVFAVESIYYHPHLQARVAERHAAVIGSDALSAVAEARERALLSVQKHSQRLCERVVEYALRDQFERHMPTSKDVALGQPISLTIDVAAAVSAELSVLQGHVTDKDLLALIARYPVRETPALTEIAKRLGFTGREQYESAIRKLLLDEAESLEFVRALFGTLSSELAAN